MVLEQNYPSTLNYPSIEIALNERHQIDYLQFRVQVLPTISRTMVRSVTSMFVARVPLRIIAELVSKASHAEKVKHSSPEYDGIRSAPGEFNVLVHLYSILVIFVSGQHDL